jgi:hypothetical protein
MIKVSPQDRCIHAASINTRYRTQGAGSPVVLVHRIGPSLEDWDRNGITFFGVATKSSEAERR